jgi:hypothetical protein
MLEDYLSRDQFGPVSGVLNELPTQFRLTRILEQNFLNRRCDPSRLRNDTVKNVNPVYLPELSNVFSLLVYRLRRSRAEIWMTGESAFQGHPIYKQPEKTIVCYLFTPHPTRTTNGIWLSMILAPTRFPIAPCACFVRHCPALARFLPGSLTGPITHSQ